jgi:uncharacterized ion transporter superfamily protein YfcC
MQFKKSLPSPLTILMIVVLIAAACTWIMPAGEYSKLNDSVISALRNVPISRHFNFMITFRPIIF